jgi:hypothetical protein
MASGWWIVMGPSMDLVWWIWYGPIHGIVMEFYGSVAGQGLSMFLSFFPWARCRVSTGLTVQLGSIWAQFMDPRPNVAQYISACFEHGWACFQWGFSTELSLWIHGRMWLNVAQYISICFEHGWACFQWGFSTELSTGWVPNLSMRIMRARNGVFMEWVSI